jgi:hypothetical protein
MLKEALMMALAFFSGRGVDLLPGVRPPVDRFDLNQNAATSVVSVSDAGPDDQVTPLLDTSDQGWCGDAYVSVTVEESSDIVEVSASFSHEIVTPSTSFSNNTGIARSNTPTGPPTNFARAYTRDQTMAIAAQPVAMIGTFTGLTPGTYRFGVGSKMTHNQTAATTSRIRELEIQATLVKR